jgi:hypothetical protein
MGTDGQGFHKWQAVVNGTRNGNLCEGPTNSKEWEKENIYGTVLTCT